MFYDDEEQAIRSRFNTQWAAAWPAVLVAYDGVEFAPVQDQDYVALSIMSGQGSVIAMGADPVMRFVGVIQVRAVVGAGDGTQRLRRYLNTASGIFRLATFSYNQSGTIRTRVPNLRAPRIGQSYVEQIMDVQFWRDVTAGIVGSTAQSGPVFPGKPTLQVVTGAVNGVNLIFTLPAVFNPANVQVYRNGQLLSSPGEYSLAGATITFVLAPQAGDVLQVFA